MPLPIAHTVISAAVYGLYRGGISLKEDYKTIGLFAFMGLLPDIDFITVPFSGFGSHRGFTHSFVFAALISSVIFFLVRVRKKDATTRLWAFLFIAVAMHPVCDYFTYDYLVERGGVMLFYPFSESYFESPFTIFIGIELRYLRTILSAHTLFAIVYETVLSLTLLGIVQYLTTGSLKITETVRERLRD